MSESANEQECRAEAARLAQLPRDVQRQILAMHWIDAENPKVPKRDREIAKDGFRAAERAGRDAAYKEMAKSKREHAARSAKPEAAQGTTAKGDS
jgi:hypothetical protein